MKKFSYTILFFILVTACNYEPIFLNKNNEKFNIVNFKVKNKNTITKNLVNSLKRESTANASKIYTIELSAEKNKEVTSRDERGNASVYRVSITCNFKIYEESKLFRTKIINKNFLFNEDKDKFKLRKYVSNLEKNLINEIVKDLILELYSS
jgi:hypothetical protein